MNKRTWLRINPYILCIVFCSASVHAFSPSPENSENYSPVDWASSDSAKNDAIYAIEHNDLRLLGFAGRNHKIPGIDSSRSQDYRDKCGIRFFEEFGDVIREREQLDQMIKAKEYAIEYNRVILTRCTLSN